MGQIAVLSRNMFLVAANSTNSKKDPEKSNTIALQSTGVSIRGAADPVYLWLSVVVCAAVLAARIL